MTTNPLYKPHKEEPIPNEFLCPISLNIMKDPVLTSDGHTYERKQIERWLKTSKSKRSPMTNKKLTSKRLIPNIALRTLINNHPSIIRTKMKRAKNVRRVLAKYLSIGAHTVQ